MTPKTHVQCYSHLLSRIRWAIGLFMLALILSGITAFPLLRELDLVVWLRGLGGASGGELPNGFHQWILTVRDGLRDTYAKYPWLAYGTDWLAFAHLIIAIFFVGPFRDPVRNVWVLQAGIVACVLVLPLALICGEIRQIPFGWRLIDCSFGLFGVLPLLYALSLTRRLASITPLARGGAHPEI